MNSDSGLVGVERCLKIIFPDAESAPGKRTFKRWMADGFFPVYKIGRRVFLNPEEVRAELVKRSKVEAVS